MAYEARRDNDLSDEDAKKEHDHQNSKNTVRVVAKGAGAYFGGSAGAKAVDIASKTKAGDKILDTAAKAIDRTKIAKSASNALNDSGAMKAAETVVDSTAGKGGGSGTGGLPNTPNQVKTNANKVPGGEQDSSLPSSGLKKNNNQPQPGSGGNGDSSDTLGKGGNKKKNRGLSKDDDSDNKEDDKKNDGLFSGVALSTPMKMALISAAPFLLIVLIFIGAIGVVDGMFGDFDDAVGISSTTGEDTGNINFTASTPEQQEFYDRVNEVKNNYQSNGKTVDALKVVAVYHVLKKNGADVKYETMDTAAIEEIANAMFDGNSYSEETFKNNLKNNIFSKYFPKATDAKKDSLVEEVFDYVEDYYDFIGKRDSRCSSGSGSCTYDIKGFYISNKGNITKDIKISDLYVRLMQCDGSYGGIAGQPLEGEELVPFEKYILGVAYAEVGTSYPEQTIKAQMVAARSYALARPTDMGGWRTLKEEDGKWVLQAAACTQDQVYCNPDQGCSGNHGQYSQVHSGLSYANGYSKPALAQDAPIRTYAAETEGEVLVNAQGYIIYSGFTSVDQNRWKDLANTGLNYKQILLQHYNQGSRNYGATDISKASCGGSSGGVCATSTGEYSTWKQFRGEWASAEVGNSGRTMSDIGCLITSLSIQVAKSGVSTNVQGELNPGTFVQALNGQNAFDSGGSLTTYSAVTAVAPDFKYQDTIYVSGMGKQEKLAAISNIVNQDGVYAVAEVKGNTGQHWVAIDSVNGDTITMMDPGSDATDMWTEYNWNNTSKIVYFKVG